MVGEVKQKVLGRTRATEVYLLILGPVINIQLLPQQE
nr:MAG TPA: hypothetical protein [Caudoviricetes sp.]